VTSNATLRCITEIFREDKHLYSYAFFCFYCQLYGAVYRRVLSENNVNAISLGKTVLMILCMLNSRLNHTVFHC